MGPPFLLKTFDTTDETPCAGLLQLQGFIYHSRFLRAFSTASLLC